jgi:hypothetical protein
MLAGAMDEYKIRYLNADGRLAEIYVTQAASQEQAKQTASAVAGEKGYKKYEVWTDYTMIQII